MGLSHTYAVRLIRRPASGFGPDEIALERSAPTYRGALALARRFGARMGGASTGMPKIGGVRAFWSCRDRRFERVEIVIVGPSTAP